MLAAIDYTSLYRYPGGYQWVNSQLMPGLPGAEPKSDHVLTVGLPEGSYDLVAYKPPPNLFLALAETPLSETGIKLFADQYGLLGLNQNDGAVPVALKIAPGGAPRPAMLVQDREDGRALGKGELLSSWRREIREIRDATNLWLALQQAVSGDSRRLARHVKWRRSNSVLYDSHPDDPLPRSIEILGIRPNTQTDSIPDNSEIGDLRTIAIIA